MELTPTEWRAVALSAANDAALLLRTGGRMDEIRHNLSRAVEAMDEALAAYQRTFGK